MILLNYVEYNQKDINSNLKEELTSNPINENENTHFKFIKNKTKYQDKNEKEINKDINDIFMNEKNDDLNIFNNNNLTDINLFDMTKKNDINDIFENLNLNLEKKEKINDFLLSQISFENCQTSNQNFEDKNTQLKVKETNFDKCNENQNKNMQICKNNNNFDYSKVYGKIQNIKEKDSFEFINNMFKK